MTPISPLESRKATRSSPSKRKRTGGQSGLDNSLGSIAGSQNRRSSSPLGGSGPTRHANSLSSLLNKVPPCIGNLNHFFSDQRFIVEAARVQPWSASEISQCVGSSWQEHKTRVQSRISRHEGRSCLIAREVHKAAITRGHVLSCHHEDSAIV